MFLWNSLVFSMFQWMLAIDSLVLSPFLNPAYTFKPSFCIHVQLKPSWKDFWHFLASMRNECICMVVGTFFGIALLWDWNENWSFVVLWLWLTFPNLLAYWVQHFKASYFFMILNSSAAIPSPPLALFILMLPKAHLTSHSRICSSR